ncbi:non-ribosomal peptide synthetase [Pelomyxa schiedti]|nr:non-ribosomal peptide synthetase [Pelomyxa schiedti]
MELFTGQVKLHGLRIELGEIEKVIHSHGMVEACTVVLREDQPGVKFLAAYLVPKDKSLASSNSSSSLISEVRNFLESKFPLYMVPSTYTVMEQLPLTSTGKLNIKSLPIPSAVEANPSTSRSPFNESTIGEEERVLLNCWKETLPSGSSALTLDTDFFQAGGDSIMALQAASKARMRGLNVTLRDFFELRTIGRIIAAKVTVNLVSSDHHLPDPKMMICLPADAIPERFLSLLKEKGIAEDQVESVFPATPNQVGILLQCFAGGDKDSQQYEERGGGLYNTQLRIDYQGDLDVGLFKRAWEAVVDDHPALRSSILFHAPTTTDCSDQNPFVQVVFKHVDLDWDQPDLTGIESASSGTPDERLIQFTAKMKVAPFDFEKPSLLRCHVVSHIGTTTLAPPFRHTFICEVHHVITDGWSTANIIHQVHETYSSMSSSSSNGSPPRQLRGRIVVHNFMKWLSVRDNKKGVQYWEKYFDGFSEPTPLPFYSLTTAISPTNIKNSEKNISIKCANESAQEDTHQSFRFEIGTTLTRKVHEFAKSHNTTVNVVLQLTWGLVLHTLAGWLHSDTSDDATFGTVLSGRPDEVDNIGEGVGLFVCTIPVRLRVQANTSTVGSLLEELHRHILLDMTEHASSVHLGEITQIVRRRHPEVQTLFETLFVFQNFPIPSFEQYSLKGLSVTGYSGSEQSHYPLVLTASLSSLSAAKCASLSPSSQHHKVEVIKLCFDYNTVIHSQGDLSRVRDCFEHLLGSVVSDPVNERKISDLDKVSPSDKQFLTEINTTNKEFPGKEKTELAVQKAVHFMFEESVLKHGSLPALKFNTKTVTYEELNNRTNQLAHFLKSTHPEAVGPGKFIPIIAERSIEQFVALYGVLKAGAAYVPIDPESPPDRISAILEDISPVSVVILSHKSLRSQLPPEQPFQVISILEDGDLWKSFPTTNPPHNIETGSEEVYAIFTSGSTGKPKAAVNHHLGVANFVMWLRDEYKLTTEDRILHKTPVFFDGCALEVFASLVSGSCVVIAPPGAHQDPEQLLQLVRDNRVTVLLLVPTMLREFISTVALAGKCRFSLRAVISAGESLHWELVHRVFDCLGKDITFHNHYGPSEASCCTTFLDCSESLKNHPEMETNNAVVPLGKPIPNVRVVIVDRNLQPVPIGVVGEICVGGVSVGKGYLSRPELTSSKFVSAPASDGIVYRTGDLGRLLPSGDVEFHGRVDFQVKLHGLRIELGEIESTILKNVSVESCAVIVREDTPGVKFLAAYLVPKDKSSLPSASTSTSRATVKAEITALLQSLLPPYMVPSTFTLLPQLPLTPTGKLDRKALPVPGAEQPSPAPSFDALLPTEELLVQCLRDALPSAFVSVLKSNSDFFSSGGTSLYVIRAAEAARKRGIKLTLRDFFEGRTIKGIAARIGNLTPMAVVDKQERPQEIPLSFAQQRLFFLDKMFPGSTQYNMCGGVELEGVLDGILLHQALRSVVLRHESLRTRFAGDITAHQIIISEEDVDSSFEMQTAVFSTNGIPKEKWLESILARESQKVYNLQTGPLLRMTFCKVDEEKCGLIVCMHHIISDGWSMGVFLKDLTEAYNNGVGRKTTASTSSAVPLIPKLAVQYVDFALWQKKFLDSDNFGKQLEYWQKDLEGVTEVAALPLDRPRTNKRNYEAGTVIYQVPIALWQELVQLGQSHRTTPFSTLLAVFQALLHRYSRMESEGDIVVGIPTANRHYPGVESMIGFFVNTLVIRVSVDNNEGFASLLDKVSRKVMASQGAQDVPFDKVVEVVGVERRLSVQPLIQVMFTMDEWNLLDKSTFSMAGVKGVREIPMTKEGLTKFDLTLSATQRESSLELNFEFARDILDTETVESMAVFMEILIRRAVSVPSDPIWKIVSLAPAEERRIEEWNSTAPVEPFKPLMTLFEEQVEKHPTGVALKMGSKTLTFHMLNCQVNQLANFLIDKYSIQPNDFIAILSDISFELFVAIYVVLKSGGAYLPIDLDSPSDRILSLLNDAKPKVILISKSSFLDLIPSSCGDEFPVISLDGTEYVHSPVTNPPCPIKTGEESIYVIPTSGSTGIPKLAVTNHLGATNYVRWFHTTDLQGTASDRCLHKTPYYFDASIGEIFSLCVSGCTVVLPERPEHIKDPEEILKLIVSEKITLVDTVPTMLNEIISLAESLHLEPDSIALRHAITGGEALHWELVRNFMKVFPRTVLDNHYGPSETSCSTTFWTTEEFDPKAPIHWPTPLGKPVPGAKVFLLDNNLHPVPFGSVGEICIGGIAVGKGYINREQLTAEKFVNVPFCAGKIYRTGDLGRILHRNGELQFVGRIDFQVKLNGLRIELGGLESTLHTHTCVKDAAVVMKTNSRNGSKYLAGYVVPSQDVLDEKGVDLEGTPAFTKVVVPGLESELLDFMATKVPQYMIPSTMTFLSSMPVSRSGKTDRKALEAMVEEEEEQEEGEQPPITENEKLVCDIWQEAFGFSGGIRTNFFHAGGNSIILTRVSKMMLSHGILITMEQFFQEPTIFGLARIADEQQQKQKNLHSHSNSNT